MTANTLFDDSYRRLFGDSVAIGSDADPFFATFYQQFLLDPTVAEFFSDTDMQHQQAMLRHSLFHLVGCYVSHKPSAELERIAGLHAKIGVLDEHYDLWLDALIFAVRTHDPDCDLATELSWRWALSPGITYMRLIKHFSPRG